MLFPPGLSYYGFKFQNWLANPSLSAWGDLVTAGGSANTEGSWANVALTGELTADVYWVHAQFMASSTSGSDREMLADIGVDPAGGTSYTEVISNLQVGKAGQFTTTGIREYLFPLFIKSGSSVAARVQSSVASNTVRCSMTFWGQPSRPEAVPTGMFSETIGTVTNSSGQSFTPGNAADGSWTSLGTTAKAMWWWQLGYSISNTAVTAEYTYIDLAYGDGSNKHTIMRIMHGGTTGEVVGETLGLQTLFPSAYCPVPAGATLYVRGRCLNAPDTGYNALAYGIGG